MSRRHVFLALNATLGLGGLAWLLWHFGRGALALLWVHPSPTLLAAFVLAVLAAIAMAAIRWRLLIDAVADPPGLASLCAFRAASQSLSAVLPGGRLGGEPLRAWYAMQAGVPAPVAITTVAVDRASEMATSLAFVVAFALVLAGRDVPGVERTVAGALVGAVSLAVAATLAVRRLRTGGLLAPLVQSLARTRPGLAQHADLVADAEVAARRLLDRPARLGVVLLASLAADALTLVQHACLLAAFGLPSSPFAVVAAVFASGAARTLPVPGAVGTVEAAELWLFGLLGHPPEVGVAVGLAVRLRDLVWAAPGFAYLLVRAARPPLVAVTAGRTAESA